MARTTVRRPGGLRALVPATLLALAGCGGEGAADPFELTPPAGSTPSAQGAAPSADTSTDTLRLDSLALEVVADGLEVPWDLEMAPDGRGFLTERVGRIRVVEEGGIRPEPWAAVDVFHADPAWQPEAGLLGIAVAPDFESSGHVYVLGVFWRSWLARSDALPARVLRRLADAVTPGPFLRFEGRVYRLTDVDGAARDPVLIVDELPANYYHAGGALDFGPDGMLYVTTGDVLNPALSADASSLAGKILRYAPDGSIPDDNPTPGSPVYAMGLRNSQGMAWDACGALVAVEHGPSGMPQEDRRGGHDELNLVRPGRDYGWPRVVGRADEDPSEPPARVWELAIAPASVDWAGRIDGTPTGDLLITALGRGGQLRALSFATGGVASGDVAAERVLIDRELGRLRLLATAPDGTVYLGTSNRDGRGAPREGDDRLFRVLLPDSPEEEAGPPPACR